MNVSDKWARDWLRSGDGRAWLEANDMPRNPTFVADKECSGSDPHPVLEFSGPHDGETVTTTTLPINGVIDVKNGGFTGWRLEYVNGGNPGDSEAAWTALTQGNNAFPQPGLIYTWDLSAVTAPQVTLRLYLENGQDGYAERRITLNLSLPTPTPSPTPTPTTIPPTAFPTDTSIPVIVTPTETVTPFPPTEAPTSTPGS
jgi:hypothetical protein